MSAAEKVIHLAARRPAAEVPPRKEGFLAIPNELMDALLAADLTGRQLKLALAVVRKTIGYGKSEDDCTITQLAEVAGLHRPDASKALQQLLDLGIISARKGRHGQLVSLNPPSSWRSGGAEQNATSTATNVAKRYAGPSQNATHNKQSQYPSNSIPPISPQGEPVPAAGPAEDATPPKPKRQPRAKGTKRTFAQWRDETKAAGAALIPEDDSVFEYAAQAGIDREFLRLAWIEFRTTYTDKLASKQYVDWRAHFRDAVRRNWYKLWWMKDDGTCELSTAGLQARNAAQAADKKGAN
ncbi:Bacteriophage lambda Replication protein O N-terminal domain-containing protein [Chromobacterium violaceum]|uniref:replication protein n=1 Tax=Chromobacterium violaceum TaxID=536 RepID=UPI003CF3B868